MATRIGRREALAGIGAVAVLGTVGATRGEAVAGVRARREIGDLEKWFPGELDLYRRAVAEVAESVAGTSAWERNARVHAAHCGGGTTTEIHRTLRFLPWHRAFAEADESTSAAAFHYPQSAAKRPWRRRTQWTTKESTEIRLPRQNTAERSLSLYPPAALRRHDPVPSRPNPGRSRTNGCSPEADARS